MKFWQLIVCAVCICGMLLSTVSLFYQQPETKPECLAQVCEKFGHEWGEWEYITVGALASLELRFFLSEEQTARYAEGARHLWSRRCPMCKESEYQCSWSDNTPNCTKDMWLAIRGEIEKVRVAPPTRYFRIQTNCFGPACATGKWAIAEENL